jgi:lipid-A-disaccharide synthase
VGGTHLKAARAHLLSDSSKWGALGIYQSLKVAPRIYAEFRKIRTWLRNQRPDLVIGIDYGYFNVRMLKAAKRSGSTTLYYMPPGSWRKDKQGKDLAEVADKIATPFQWSADVLRGMGADAVWVGHPILQMAGQPNDGPRQGVAVLPGSRTHEVRNNLPTIAAALERLAEKVGPIRLALAPTVEGQTVLRLWQKVSRLPLELRAGPAIETLKQSRVAVVCSGTATLEAAVARTPMVIVYRGDKIMEWEYRLRRPKFSFIGLPSILLDRLVCPELIQWDATPQRISEELCKLLDDSPERRAQLDAFDHVEAALGPRDSLTRTAEIALTCLAEATEANGV